MDARTPACNLVADIGGTNTRLGLTQGDQVLPDTIKRLSNTELGGFDALLAQYIADHAPGQVDGICVALAGPVENGAGAMTNLNWHISEPALKTATGAHRALVLNDLQAQGYALGHIPTESVQEIFAGESPNAAACKMVIGVGTGFNSATVHETPFGRFVSASESGHMSLPARHAAEREVFDTLAGETGFASIEDVLSGAGILKLDQWVQNSSDTRVGGTAAVFDAANAGDRTARETLEIACRLFGSVAGNLALSHLPLGGIYLIGGVARAMAPHLKENGFMDAFCDMGRFQDYMKRFPILLIEDDFAALTGCAKALCGKPT